MVELEAQLRGEPPGKGETTLDPRLLPPQEFPDGGDREAVLIGERGGHARLVHGADRARRRVRGEEPRLLGDAGGKFDHDGDFLAALRGPDDQALEAVEDLVDAVRGGGDADGERREERSTVPALAAKSPQRGPEAIHGDELDEAHRRTSPTGRIWKRG